MDTNSINRSGIGLMRGGNLVLTQATFEDLVLLEGTEHGTGWSAAECVCLCHYLWLASHVLLGNYQTLPAGETAGS